MCLGHAECVSFMRKQGIPMLILGGGGYTIRNVARCWTFETAVALDCDITNGECVCVCVYVCMYRIFSKNSALHNFVAHSFVSKKSLTFDEMAIF